MTTLKESLDKSGLCDYDHPGDLAFMVSAMKFAAIIRNDVLERAIKECWYDMTPKQIADQLRKMKIEL